jgi:hydrogenase maturation protease
MNPTTLVLGLGNSLAGDDAVGLEAARRLAALPLPPGVRVVAAESPGLDLIDLLADSGRAILLETVVAEGPVGAIHRLKPDQLAAREGALSAHDFGVAEALRLAELAEPERLPRELVILAMTIAPPSSGSVGLSEQAEAALPRLIEAALEEIERPCTKPASQETC